MLFNNIFGDTSVDALGADRYPWTRGVHAAEGAPIPRFCFVLFCFVLCTHSKVSFCCWFVSFFCAALSPFMDEASIKKVIFRGRCVSSLFLLGQ